VTVQVLLLWALMAYSYVLLAHVILSWVPRPPEPLTPFVIGIRRLVEPVAMPIRRVLPPLRLGAVALDLSILVLFLLVRVAQTLVVAFL